MDYTELEKIYPRIPVGTRAENLSGQQFNKWKVLYRTNNIGTKVSWVCECQCENKTIRVVQSRNLKNNLSKDCGCGRKQTMSERADLKIHKRDVDGNIILKHCFRCNQWLPLDNFWKNRAQKDGYCGECKKCQNNSKENKYNIYKKGAKSRNIIFNLSKEQFYNLISQPCYYCGEKEKDYNGIDRVNSQQGYEINNCVPCCEYCNKMKLDYTTEFWFLHMKKIINRWGGNENDLFKNT